jgi:hypothetical protein
MQSTVLDLEPTTLSDGQLSHLSPLGYADLRADHQQLVEDASGEGRAKACPPVPNAVESFVTLVRDRVDRQWKEYGGKPENRPEYLRSAYLERNRSHFELEVYVEDIVISG